MTKRNPNAGPSGKRYDWSGVPTLVAAGKTSAEIARIVGCTTPAASAWLLRREIHADRKCKTTLDRFGCSVEVARALNGGKPLNVAGCPASHYRMSWRAAEKRGVGWEFTFPEWIAVWEGAGGLHLRGRRPADLCMARHGDTGPYSRSNVTIKTTRENIQESFVNVKRRKAALKPVGNGRGWCYCPRQTKRPYMVSICNRTVGCFPTEQEARAAYLTEAARVNASRGFVSTPTDQPQGA